MSNQIVTNAKDANSCNYIPTTAAAATVELRSC